jgi:integrase
LQVRIRGSKTDQEGKGHIIGITPGRSACPIKAVIAWLKTAGIKSGPIFRPIFKGGRVANKRLSARAIAEIVKRYARQIGVDPKKVSAHSLRAGFLTSAAQRGASIFKLMEVSRHKSVDTLNGYVRNLGLFNDHAGTDLL